MRPTLATFLLACALAASAQPAERPRVPGPVPPPPVVAEGQLAAEPEVTVRKEGEDTVHEYRQGGQLYMMRVVPATGRPYVLVDRKGDGHFTRLDNNLDNGVRVPQWVLLEF